MTLVVTGLEEAIKFMDKIADKKVHDEAMLTLIIETIKLAQLYAPEDTGAMEENIYYDKISDMMYAIICTVPYAIYNEFGTYNMPAGDAEQPLPVTSRSGKRAYRPFLRPAIYQTLKSFPEYIKKFVLS